MEDEGLEEGFVGGRDVGFSSFWFQKIYREGE